MKSWEPDLEFEKADFPSRKSQDPDAPRSKNEPANPSAGTKTGGRNRGPSSTADQTAGSETAAGLRKAAFPKINPAGALPKGSVISGKSPPAPASPAPGQRGQETPEPTQLGRAAAGGGRQAAALTVRLLQESAIAAPENTLRFLRKWFWEKWPAQSDPGPVGSVSPQDRIEILFTQFGEKVSTYLLQLMPPLERGRFQEILQRRRSFSQATVALVAREFMNGIRREGQV